MNGTTTAQLAEKTAKAVTGSVEEWTGFLQSAARLYKYSYRMRLPVPAMKSGIRRCGGMSGAAQGVSRCRTGRGQCAMYSM